MPIGKIKEELENQIRSRIQSIRILIIDDDDGLRAVLHRMLQSGNYNVLEAADGKSGLQIWKEQQPEIVITDLQLPDIDGLEVLRTIRESDSICEVVMLTGHGDMNVAIEALKLKASDFLLKPVDMDRLKMAMNRLIENISLKFKLQYYTHSLEQAVQDIKHSHEFLESLIRTTPSAIITYDTEGKITRWNHEAEKITGYASGEALGRPFHDLFKLADPLINTEPAGSREGKFENRLTKILDRSDRVIYIARNARAVFGPDGRWNGGIESFLDVTKKIKRDGLLQKRFLQVQTLNEISRLISSSTELQDLLQGSCDYLINSFFRRAQITVFMKDDERPELVLHAISGQYAEEIAGRFPLGYRQNCETGILGHVYRSGAMYFARDVNRDPFFHTGTLRNVKSEFALPIKFKNKVLGILNLESLEPANYDDVDISMLETISEYIGIGVHRLKLLQRVQKQKNRLEAQADKLSRALKEVEHSRTVIENQNVQMINELKKAAKFQNSLLPAKFPYHKDLQFDALFVPSNRLGGDFYDVLQPDENHTAFIVADASGHGVASAMLTAMFKMTLRKYKKDLLHPARLLKKLNRDFCQVLSQGEFFTTFYAIYDHRSSSLTFSNASHPRPYLFNGSVEIVRELDSDGFMLGVMNEGIKYQQKTIRINGPHRLLIYTDGLIEVMNENEVGYGTKRLKECATAYRNLPPHEFLQNLFISVKAFCGGEHFSDDISIMVVDINP